jgi:hypothetical protein
MSIDKQYHAELKGTGLGQMLAGMAAEVKDSGAYVAIDIRDGKHFYGVRLHLAVTQGRPSGRPVCMRHQGALHTVGGTARI